MKKVGMTAIQKTIKVGPSAKGLRRSLSVLLLLFISGLSPHSFATAGEKAALEKVNPQEELHLLVQQFLASADPDQSDSLMKEIKNYKGATVQGLEKAVETGLYPPQPLVGPLHLSIQVDGEPKAYALYVPEKYNPASSYPLIICLHGAGFNGDTYLERWQARLGEKALLACPTMENGAWWTPEAETLILGVIDSIQSKYHIDPNRIFLTGMSNGGIGSYLIGMFHADRFAAISPMAAGIPEEIFPFLKNLTSTGIYIIHGSKDEVMPVSLSRKASDYLKGEGIRYTYREHDLQHPMAGGHFFPKEELPALVAWFEQQHRNPYPVRVISVRDQVHLAPFYWTEINETAGEVANVQDSMFDKKEVERVKKGAFSTLIAEVRRNRIEVKTERVKKYTLYFNHRLIDFSKPVVIMTNGQKSFEGKLSESPEALLKEAKRRKDPGAFYSASVTVDVPPPK